MEMLATRAAIGVPDGRAEGVVDADAARDDRKCAIPSGVGARADENPRTTRMTEPHGLARDLTNHGDPECALCHRRRRSFARSTRMRILSPLVLTGVDG